MDDPVECLPPEVPDFDLIRPIGSGGYGQVWLATNRTTGKLRAVKVIALQSGQADPATREISSLVRLEANLRCQHPNLLHIHHVGKTARHLFYVMDPADDAAGGPALDRPEYRPATLQRRLENVATSTDLLPSATRCGLSHSRSDNVALQGAAGLAENTEAAFSPEVCLDYARQLLAGLAALHAAGMVHRDVKPANCLFVGGQLKLADFGLLTQSHPLVSRLGTQKYMPPDGRMDMRADVYAGGLVIYEMLSGLPVDEFPRLGPRAREIGDSRALAVLLRLVLRACEREPERRFADARAMLAELEGPQKTAPRASRRRFVLMGCATAVLALAGFAGWMLRPTPADLDLVDVSFVTRPYEAKIYLDDKLLTDRDGKAYTTPCTVERLAAGTHRIEFEQNGRRWDAGQYDFGRTRQIVSKPPPN